MATPFSVIAEDDLTCPVCYELFRDPNTPKLLDCPHVCCAVCIQKMIEGGKRIVDCPECRHVTRIPKEGVTAMKTILRVRSLAEKHAEHSKKAQSYVKTTTHSQNPIKKGQTTAAICPEHNIAIDFYCKKCKIAGCYSCMVYKHKGLPHDIDEVQHVYQDQKGCMEALLSKATKEIEEGEQSVQELGVLQGEMNKMMKKSLKVQYESIEKQAELAIKKVQEEVQSLKDNLRNNEEHRIYRVQQERNRLQIQVQEAKAVMTTAKNTMERTEIHEYIVKHDQLAQTVSSALSKDTKGLVNRNPIIGVTRYVCDKPFNVKGNLGRIEQVIRQLKCILFQEFGEFKSATNVTATSSGPLVVNDYNGSQMFIYSQQQNGQYRKRSSLSLSSKNTTEKPRGIAVTPEGKYLVARITHVEVYSPSGKYEGTLNFRQKNQSATAHGIVVMPDGTIVVLDFIRSILTILTQDETILSAISISIEPFRVAVMPHGHIAVCNWMQGKVCVIDLESGREVKTFDIPHAMGICYHEQTDCLLIGRCLELSDDGYPTEGSGVIEQYCRTTGRLVACIAEGLYMPIELNFTPDGMLAVADDKTVKVYKLV